MIAQIRLENFKRFCNLNLRTANLTVLTGANGAGKTTVLQPPSANSPSHEIGHIVVGLFKDHCFLPN